MDTKARVRAFILGNFYVPDPAHLRDDMSLVDTGLVDSTGMLEIIEFIETDLGVLVGEREVVPDNFDNVERIAAYVERKAAA